MEQHFDRFQRHVGRNIFRVFGFVFSGIILALLLASIFGAFVMLLWNWLMPDLFGLKAVTYLQAFGITILAKLIFGHLGHPPRHHRPPFGHFHRHGPAWLKNRCNGDDAREDCSFPTKNWRYYREYWKTRGRNDFEQYLRENNLTEDGAGQGDCRG